MLWTWNDPNQAERNSVDIYCIICIYCESFPEDATNAFYTFILFGVIPNGKWLVDRIRRLISRHYLGLPIPAKLKTILEQLHDRAEKEEEKEGDK